MTWKVIPGDCIESMKSLDDESIDAIVTDPPYGLEFMGKSWDRLEDPEWMESATANASVGLGDRATPWVSYGGETANPTCAVCGGRKRGAKRCGCDRPDWRVKGKPYNPDARRVAKGARQQAWHARWLAEAFRVLKPGGYLVAFGGSRTFHRLAVAIEDCGFEIRDVLSWHYGSGFPKGQNVGKAIDKAAGAERKVVGSGASSCPDLARGEPCRCAERLGDEGRSQSGGTVHSPATAPATPEAEAWEGWNTALKPAWEPVVVGRKPLTGTVVDNVLTHGTGAMNIGGCRIGAPDAAREGNEEPTDGATTVFGAMKMIKSGTTPPEGRWPSNVVLSHAPGCRRVGEAVGHKPSRERLHRPGLGVYGEGVHGSRAIGSNEITHDVWECVEGCPVAAMDAQGGPTPATGSDQTADGGLGASRFFYTSKAANDERWGWCKDCGAPVWRGSGAHKAAHGQHDVEWHPTVKPIDLMQWLVRLVTPPGGTVLDTFAGTGTTGEAAHQEGFDVILMEREPVYVQIIRARMEDVQGRGVQVGLFG